MLRYIESKKGGELDMFLFFFFFDNLTGHVPLTIVQAKLSLIQSSVKLIM